MEFIEFIKAVLDRPAMFCVNNVEDLSLFLTGYNYGSANEETNNILSDFRDFVNKHFESKDDVNWPRLIRFYSASDHHSLEVFRKLFFNFIETKE